MADKEKYDPDGKQVDKKIEELIRKKSDENSALKKLLKGLSQSGDLKKKDI